MSHPAEFKIRIQLRPSKSVIEVVKLVVLIKDLKKKSIIASEFCFGWFFVCLYLLSKTIALFKIFFFKFQVCNIKLVWEGLRTGWISPITISMFDKVGIF